MAIAPTAFVILREYTLYRWHHRATLVVRTTPSLNDLKIRCLEDTDNALTVGVFETGLHREMPPLAGGNG